MRYKIHNVEAIKGDLSYNKVSSAMGYNGGATIKNILIGKTRIIRETAFQRIKKYCDNKGIKLKYDKIEEFQNSQSVKSNQKTKENNKLMEKRRKFLLDLEKKGVINYNIDIKSKNSVPNKDEREEYIRFENEKTERVNKIFNPDKMKRLRSMYAGL